MPTISKEQNASYSKSFNDIVQAFNAQFISRDEAYNSIRQLNAAFKICPKCGENCGYYNLPLVCGK